MNNKKLLEDIKMNVKPQQRLKEKVLSEATPQINPPDTNNSSINILKSNSTIISKSSIKRNTKYDFLSKLNKKTSSQRISQTPQVVHIGHSFNKFILFIFALSVLVGAYYLVSTVFFKAKVTVIAKNKLFELNKDYFTAGKINTSKNVPFEVMIVEDTEVKDVILTSSRESSEKAKGEVILYNEYSTKPVKIIADSFLSDEKGKTYKTDVTIFIPGYTTIKSVVVPGQMPVKITSFLPGDTYNGNPELFTLNAYKGTIKSKKIYGKIKTPISGGSTGLIYTLDEKEKDLYSANTSIFRDKLMRKLVAQVPAGYILYPDATNFVYGLDEGTNSKTPNAKISMKGTLSAILLKQKELSDIVIDKLLPEILPIEKSEIVSPDLSVLTFNFSTIDQLINKDIDKFNFELSGNLLINWKPEVNSLKSLLIAKKKIDLAGIFKQDPGIFSANVKIFPFWSKVMPENAKNINIILK